MICYSLLIISCTTNSTAPLTGGWQEATDSLTLLAPGIISTAMNERDVAIAPDGKMHYFTVSTSDRTMSAIVSINRHAPAGSKPEIVEFSGRYLDLEPFISPDGKTMFFASDRPENESDTLRDYNIWMVRKTMDGWDTPQVLPTTVNSPADEFFPSVSKNGNLYFTATREGTKGLEDIFISRYVDGEYLEAVSLDKAVNTPAYEFNAWISPDEDLLIFSSYGRQDGFGRGDLYISRKDTSGMWLPAENAGPLVNSPQLDYCPYLDQHNGVFYFTSNRFEQPSYDRYDYGKIIQRENSLMNGKGNIYQIRTSALHSWFGGN